ncbi:hypothetical protein BI330_09005 [Mycobacterium sp. CBMA 623]|nr:hypothetical protein [Mycobacteroides sp. CBMA 326]
MLALAGCNPDPRLHKMDPPGASTPGGTTTTTGSPSRKPPDTTYRSRQTPEVQQQLAAQDRVRAGDPCGRLSPDAVLALGKVSYFGVDIFPSQCRIIFDVPKAQNSVHEITVGSATSLGQPTGAEPNKDRCYYRFEVAGLQTLLTFGLDQGYDVPGDNGAKLCGIAESLAKASGTTLASPPPREGSRWVPQDKLMRVDPCGPMNTLGAQQDFVIRPHSQIFNCFFYERADTKRERGRSIYINYLDLAQAPRPKQKGPDLIDIGGELTKAITKSSKGAPICDFTVYVGLNEPLTGSDPLSQSKQWIGTIEVQGPPAGTSCSEVEKLTAEAVRLYQQA